MTLSELRAQVIADIERPDLSNAVALAISSAIDYYSREMVPELESYTTFTSSSSQIWYAVAANRRTISHVVMKRGSDKWKLKRTSNEELDERDAGTVFGEPSEWAVFGSNMRFYPVPNSASYIFMVAGTTELADISDTGTASTIWTSTYRDLIRYKAEYELYSARIKDLNMAQSVGGLLGMEYQKFQRDILSKKSNTIRKVWL